MIGRRAVAIDEGLGELDEQLTDFFGEHYDRLVRLAALICHSSASVEDAVQGAMEQAWRRRYSLRDRSRLKPWLDQIVVRESIRQNSRPWWNRLRGQGTQGDLPETGGQLGGVDPNWIALSVAFRQLPAEQRAAVALHLYAGYALDETARLMGASLETTRSRLRLARQRLRRELGDER